MAQPPVMGSAEDPFGQFLATMYMMGNMPGNQTSAFNTVLDLLSPGAVQDRREAGTPDVSQQFANMFGGMNMTPDQIGQMQEQQAGLRLTPQEQEEGSIAREGQRLDLQKAMEKARSDIDAAQIAADAGVQGEEIRGQYGLDIANINQETARLELQAGRPLREAQTGAFNRQGVVDPTDPRVVSAQFDANVKSMLTTGRLWDFEAGQPGREATPGELRNAQGLAGIMQGGPQGAVISKHLNSLLSNQDANARQVGMELFKQLTGFGWDDGGWFGLGQVVTPGGTDPSLAAGGGTLESAIDYRAYLVSQLPGAANPEGQQAAIDEIDRAIIAAGGPPLDAGAAAGGAGQIPRQPEQAPFRVR